ncbi:MAG: flagellar hook-associated protein FlgL [Candidatus Riflebacteria bacterium]|nr:flagellar hook-associated protein FlgL [Candidatus Riflebacteria bacterium]
MDRISTSWVTSSFLNVLNRNQEELSKMQIKISSGKQIIQASENPVNNALSMQSQTDLFQHTQYLSNIDRTKEWLDSTDGTMTDIESTMQRVRELAVQGANDTLVQTDRDAIGGEINQLLQHLVDTGNTDVAGEYIFSGNDVNTKPLSTVSGQTTGAMTSVVTTLGETRLNQNISNSVDVGFNGDNKKLITEIDSGVTIDKNISGADLFYRGAPIVPEPSFGERSPTLSPMLNVDALNDGRGMQPGLIVITDSNGIDRTIDLKSAVRIDDVVALINQSGSFKAGIQETPSDTAAALGLYRNGGATSILVGLSDPAMQALATPLASLNGGQGMPAGFLSINTRDGRNHRLDLSSALTVGDVVDKINGLENGATLSAKFDPIRNRLEITDKTSGSNDFSIESKKNQLYIEDLPPHTALDLGLLKNAGAGNTINATFDPAIESVATPLSALNAGKGIETGYLKISRHDGTSATIDLTKSVTVQDAIDSINTGFGSPPGPVVAAFDATSRMISLSDTTAGGNSFRVEEVTLPAPGATTAASLGILQNAGGGTTITSIADPAITSGATLLSTLNSGAGISQGFIRISRHDGSFETIDLHDAKTVQNVVDMVNLRFDGQPVAAFNSGTNRIDFTDSTLGTHDFRIEESSLPIKVREVSTVANPLGLSKSAQGSLLIGDQVGIGFPATTALSALVPPPQKGFIEMKGSDGKTTEVDLSNVTTIQDVVDKINETGKYTARWDQVKGWFTVQDNNAVPGGNGITIEEKSNTARDLGFLNGSTNQYPDKISGAPIPVKNLPTLIGSLDLNPAVDGNTELSTLNNSRQFNKGVQLGRIRITDKAGRFATIDLRGAKTVQDVLNKINDPANGIYVEAKINANRNGIELDDKNHGASGWFQVADVDFSAASDLGIAGKTIDNRLVGTDIDPAVTEKTSLSLLRVGEGGVPTGKVFVQSGEFSGEIDLTGAKTVGDLMQKISTTDTRFNLAAWIDDDGKRLNLTNTKGQPFIKVRDLGKPEEAVASAMGLGGTRGIFQTLTDLRDSLFRGDGTAISVQSIREISSDLENTLKLHAQVGVKTNRVDASKEKQTNLSLNINKLLNSVENIDMTEAITKMTTLQTAFSAALQTGARVLQTTLMDFLK